MEILEGIISVKAAISAKSREIESVFIDLEKYKNEAELLYNPASKLIILGSFDFLLAKYMPSNL